MGVSALAAATALPHATTHRLLRTLALKGYVRQEHSGRDYVLGPRLMALGEAASGSLNEWVRPFLVELAEFSGETANMAVLAGTLVSYVSQAASNHHRVRMFAEVGNRLLPHTSAVGKVLLAYRPRSVAERAISEHGLPRRTANTITDPVRFLSELDRVLEQGFAIDDEEEELGVRCIAVPVLNVFEYPLGISVSAPAGRLDEGRRERLIPEMRGLAARISDALLTEHASRSVSGGSVQL